MLPWPSGNGTSLTRKGSQVRVLPGVLFERMKDEVGRMKKSQLYFFTLPLSSFILADCGVDWSLVPSTVSYAARRRFKSGLRNFFMAEYANRQSGQVQTLGLCGFDSHLGYCKVLRCYGGT